MVLVRVGHGAVHIGVVVGVVLGRVVRVLRGVLVAQVLLVKHTVQSKVVLHCLANQLYQFCPIPFLHTGRHLVDNGTVTEASQQKVQNSSGCPLKSKQPN